MFNQWRKIKSMVFSLKVVLLHVQQEENDEEEHNRGNSV